MKRIAMVFALVATLSVPAVAQRGHGAMKWLDEATITSAKELATSLTTWARADVLPELQAWKNRLDASLSPTDLAKLNELRQKAASLKSRRLAVAKQMRESWKGEDYDALKKSRNDLKALQSERKELLDQLKPIATANRAVLEEIGEMARPKIREWTDAARTIGEQWFERNRTTINPGAAMAIGRLMKHKHDLFALVDAKVRTKAAAAHFMLWGGEDFTRDVDGMIRGGDIESLRELNLE